MATAAADAGERVAGEQAFDAVKWFSQRYLHGHQTRANYFWLDRDTVQKFVDNNICNVDRATNLTAADLDHFGVPLSKREALLRELSTLGCNSGPSSARLSGKGCHPASLQKVADLTAGRGQQQSYVSIGGLTGLNPVAAGAAAHDARGLDENREYLRVLETGDRLYHEIYSANGGDGGGDGDKLFYKDPVVGCLNIGMECLSASPIAGKISQRVEVRVPPDKVRDRISLLITQGKSPAYVAGLARKHALFGYVDFRSIILNYSKKRCAIYFCV